MGLQTQLPLDVEEYPVEPDEALRQDNPVKRVAQKYKLKVDGDAAERLAADLESGIERAADLCRVDPPVCRDNLGIGRGEMPQIDENTLPFFLDAWRKTGTRVTADVVPVGKLKATQMEINAGKVAGMAQAAVDGKFPTIQAPVIISSDSFVLDGHHRWAALMVLSPGNVMHVHRVEVPIQSLLQAARQFEGTTFAGLREKNPGGQGCALSAEELGTIQAALDLWEKSDTSERRAYFADPQDALTEDELQALKERLSGAEEDARLTPPAGEYEALVARIREREKNPSVLGELRTALRYFDDGKPAKAEAPVRRAAEELESKPTRGDWAQKYGGHDETPMRVRNPLDPSLVKTEAPDVVLDQSAADAVRAGNPKHGPDPAARYGYDYTTGEGQKRLMRENAPTAADYGYSGGRGYESAIVKLPGEFGQDPIFRADGEPTGLVRMVPTGRILDVSTGQEVSGEEIVARMEGPSRTGNPSQQQLDPAATEPDLDDDSDLDDPEDEPIDYGNGDGDVPDEWVGDMPEDARMHMQLERPAETALNDSEKAIRDSATWENSNSAERNVPTPTKVVPPPTQAEQDEYKREVGVTAAIGTALASHGGIREVNPRQPVCVCGHPEVSHWNERKGGKMPCHFDWLSDTNHHRCPCREYKPAREKNPGDYPYGCSVTAGAGGGWLCGECCRKSSAANLEALNAEELDGPPEDEVGGNDVDCERCGAKYAPRADNPGGPDRDPITFREPQSLHFPKEKFSKTGALDWCEENECVPIKAEATDNQWRLRLRPPQDFKQGSFKTFTTHDGVQVILGEPKRGRNPLGVVPLANLISAAAGVGGAVKQVAAPKGE